MNDNSKINKDWNLEALKKYSGFEIHPYDAYQVTPFALVFITRPKLFIKRNSDSRKEIDKIAYNNMAKHPYLSRFIDSNVSNKKDKIIVDLLSYYNDNTEMEDISTVNFIPIFTNRIKNFPVDGNHLQTAEQGLTKHGFRHIYPTTNIPSLTNGTINLDFYEMQDSEISNLIGIWYNTIVGMVNGELRANPELIKNNRIDFNSSLYYFKLDRDAQTIRYWAKYNGLFPTNMPSEAFSYQEASVSLTNMSVSMSYDSREELTLSILDDFNNTSLNRTHTLDNMSSNELSLSLFSKDTVLSKAEEDGLLDRVPLIYVEENSTSIGDKKRFVLKLGSRAVYKSASEEMFGSINASLVGDYGFSDRSDEIGSMGSRSKLYQQQHNKNSD